MVRQDQNATPDSYQVDNHEINGAEDGCELSNMDKAIPNAEATSELNGKYQLGTSCIPKALASGEAVTNAAKDYTVPNLGTAIPHSEVATNHPLRIQRRRTKGFRHPIGTKHITRPGRFGNPFISAESFAAWLESGDVADDLRGPLTAEALEERRQWILTNVHTLRGKILACFCGLGKPCHGDELARLANGTGVSL